MNLLADLRTVYRLALAPARGPSHAGRLDAFYRDQAEHYDAFRERLLPGRGELFESVACDPGAVWLDVGGGTAANVERLAPRLPHLGRVLVLDLADSLLAVAARRRRRAAWRNVELLKADAAQLPLPDSSVDVVTFSYSLTMIPDWFAALDEAARVLRPGGRIGVVDFYVSRKHARPGHARHPWSTRTLWPTWFAADNVFLSPDHVPYLHRRWHVASFVEGRSRIPYLPWVRVPYYRFVGACGNDRQGSLAGRQRADATS